MKSVLLPTDLSVQSLWPVKEIIKTHSGEEQLLIHVIHMIEAPANIHDLMCLGRSKNNIPLPSAFADAFSALRNKYWGVPVTIQFDFLYGDSNRILKNFIEGAGIEQVFLLDGYTYTFNHKLSVNFTSFIERIKTPIKYISYNPRLFSEFQILSMFLNKTEKDVKEMAFTTSIAN